MKTIGAICVLMAVFSSTKTVLAAFIEVPDELLENAQVSLLGEGELVREKRQFQLQGGGGADRGSLSTSYSKPLINNDKTSLVGTLNGEAAWNKGVHPNLYSGSARLDGTQNLFDNGRTRVDANAYLQRDVARFSKPHDSYGGGLGVTHTITQGRHGSLEAFGGYQGQFSNPRSHNFGVGIRGRF